MPTYLLDTTVIIDALNDKHNRKLLLLDLLKQGHLLGCCPINVTEVYAGVRPKEETATAEFLQSLQYYQVTWPIARVAGLLKRDYARRGKTLTVSDATIAARVPRATMLRRLHQSGGTSDHPGPAALREYVAAIPTVSIRAGSLPSCCCRHSSNRDGRNPCD